MRRALPIAVSILLAVALLGLGYAQWSPDDGRKAVSTGAVSQGAAPATGSARPVHHQFASLEDKGDLLGYPDTPASRSASAPNWYRADISEQHALWSIVAGTMAVTAPDGTPVRLRYQRHIEHPNGNWTWIGRNADGREAIVTFGEKAVFGSIPSGDTELRLTTMAGRSWVIQVDPRKEREPEPKQPDYLVPPELAAALASSGPVTAAAETQAAVAAAAATTVDVALGYTTGFASEAGGDSQAVTRLQHLVDVTNQAYTNSQINAQIRLVKTVSVAFADGTDNDDALTKLTGYKSGTGSVPVDPAFAQLRAARDQYGADLVSLVRRFRTPENGGCGLAWLIGGNQSTINSSDAPFGYSVVSDDIDKGDRNENDGLTYACRKESLAHELGHNMGQNHNVEDAGGDSGAHSYSYGYREASTTGFYTVMAYRLANSSQRGIRYFANPNVAEAGTSRPTGVANSSDNARSMAQTMPLIAQFRATIVPPPVMRPFASLYSISKLGGGGFTDMHVLTGESGYQAFRLQTPTSLGQTGTSNVWQFALNDLNRDGAPDLYSIFRQGGSGRTELYVLDGARNYRASLLQVATVLPVTGTGLEWAFKLGDYNRDGVADLYVIYRMGASGKTEVHVVDGATNFQTYLAHIATALGQTGTANAWQFELADRNNDGVLDLYCINRVGTQRTEVHVLDGASSFQTPLLQVATALSPVGTGSEWDFKLADYNRDGITDLYTIYRIGASGKTELHVLDGGSGFGQFSAHIATGLPATGTDASWEFELWPQ